MSSFSPENHPKRTVSVPPPPGKDDAVSAPQRPVPDWAPPKPKVSQSATPPSDSLSDTPATVALGNAGRSKPLSQTTPDQRAASVSAPKTKAMDTTNATKRPEHSGLVADKPVVTSSASVADNRGTFGTMRHHGRQPLWWVIGFAAVLAVAGIYLLRPGADITEVADQPLRTPTPTPEPLHTTDVPVSPGQFETPTDPIVVRNGEPHVRGVTNVGASIVQYDVQAEPWLRVTPVNGVLQPGESIELFYSVDDAAPEGNVTGDVVITWSVNDEPPTVLTIPVTATVERPPVFQLVQLGSTELFPRGCGTDRTEVGLVIVDESPLQNVTLRFTVPTSDGDTSLVLSNEATEDGSFRGVLGPFEYPGQITVQATATDLRGNTKTLTTDVVTVLECPLQQ